MTLGSTGIQSQAPLLLEKAYSSFVVGQQHRQGTGADQKGRRDPLAYSLTGLVLESELPRSGRVLILPLQLDQIAVTLLASGSFGSAYNT